MGPVAAAKVDDEQVQWTLARTLAEKKPGEVTNEFSKGVFPGGFTRANEKFVSRVAMLGMFGTIVNEAITGNGALAQFDLETGFTLAETEDLLLLQIAIIAGLAFTGFATNGKWVTDPAALDWQKRNFYPADGSTNWRTAFGLNPEGPLFGFTEANELFIGRLAQMAFLITTAIEAATGFGPLKQFGLETGIASGVTDEIIIGSAAFFALSAVFPTLLAFINKDPSAQKVKTGSGTGDDGER